MYAFPQGTESIEGLNLNITKRWTPPPGECSGSDTDVATDAQGEDGGTATVRSNSKQRTRTSTSSSSSSSTGWNRSPNDDDDGRDDSINVIEGATLSKVSRSSNGAAAQTMGSVHRLIVAVIGSALVVFLSRLPLNGLLPTDPVTMIRSGGYKGRKEARKITRCGTTICALWTQIRTLTACD